MNKNITHDKPPIAKQKKLLQKIQMKKSFIPEDRFSRSASNLEQFDDKHKSGDKNESLRK